MDEYEDLRPAKTDPVNGFATENTGTESAGKLQCSGVYSLKIDKEKALYIAEEWIHESAEVMQSSTASRRRSRRKSNGGEFATSVEVMQSGSEVMQIGAEARRIINNQRQKNALKFGKAVLVYYPFWKYLREDGGENKTIFRPACGTLLTGLQNMQREDSELIPVPDGIRLINPTVKSSVYLNEIHGIARGESLIAVPLWVISYKFKNIIYMVEVDGVNGTVYPEWHPVKEPVNWNKIALYCIIPMMILSLISVGAAPWLFIIIIAAILLLIYYSKVISLINEKRKEGRDGT